MIRIAICDDDTRFVTELEGMIKKLEPQLNQEFDILPFYSGERFCQYLDENSHTEPFDIVLMDIEMEGMSGVEAGERLREDIANDLTLLAYVSFHEGYSREIINLNVSGFISKPLNNIESNIQIKRIIEKTIRLRQLPQIDSLMIKKDGKEIYIPKHTIVFAESEGRKVHIHTLTTTHSYNGKLGDLECELSSKIFARIHRSYIVNFNHAASVSSICVTINAEVMLPISESYREKASDAYHFFREDNI